MKYIGFKFFKYKNRGFTILELLVVIAIIGILAAIVITAVGDARDKAADSAVKTSFNHMQKQMNLYFETTGAGKYGSGQGAGTITSSGVESGLVGVCTDSNFKPLLVDSASKSGNTINCTVGNNGNSLLVYVRLKSQTSPANYCLDYQGFVGVLSSNPAVTQAGSTVRCQ